METPRRHRSSSTLPADAGLLRLVRLVASGLASTAGFDVDELDDLRIAVDEAVAALLEGGDGTRLPLRFERRRRAGGDDRAPTPASGSARPSTPIASSCRPRSSAPCATSTSSTWSTAVGPGADLPSAPASGLRRRRGRHWIARPTRRHPGTEKRRWQRFRAYKADPTPRRTAQRPRRGVRLGGPALRPPVRRPRRALRRPPAGRACSACSRRSPLRPRARHVVRELRPADRARRAAPPLPRHHLGGPGASAAEGPPRRGRRHHRLPRHRERPAADARSGRRPPRDPRRARARGARRRRRLPLVAAQHDRRAGRRRRARTPACCSAATTPTSPTAEDRVLLRQAMADAAASGAPHPRAALRRRPLAERDRRAGRRQPGARVAACCARASACCRSNSATPATTATASPTTSRGSTEPLVRARAGAASGEEVEEPGDGEDLLHGAVHPGERHRAAGLEGPLACLHEHLDARGVAEAKVGDVDRDRRGCQRRKRW